ncbi:MAG: cytochrome c family protein [Polyangiales bacterium]
MRTLPDLRFAILTDLQGAVQPCGCTSHPLGGLDHLGALLSGLHSKKDIPLLTFFVGDTFFSAPQTDDKKRAEERWNVNLLVNVLSGFGPSAVLLGDNDHRTERAWLFDDLDRNGWPIMTRTPGVVANTILDVGKTKVGVIAFRDAIDSAEAVSTELFHDAVASLRKDGAAVVVALVVGGRKTVSAIAKAGPDFIILGGVDEEDANPPVAIGKSWVLHASRQGRGVAVVDLFFGKPTTPWRDESPWSLEKTTETLKTEIASLEQKIAQWKKEGSNLDAIRAQEERVTDMRTKLNSMQKPPNGDGSNHFVATWVPFDKASPTDPEISRRMLLNDQRINAHNKEALADLKPLAVPKGQATFVGSQTCASCHADAVSWWKGHPHGRAYQTLVDRHKEYSLDCVGCHVTGYDRPGGATVTQNLNGALVNVGCESCHGAASLHIASPPSSIIKSPDASVCLQCHTPEHSDLFNFERYRDSLIVPGHGVKK